LLLLHYAFKQEADSALACCGVTDFGAWSEDTEGWVDGDLFDDLHDLLGGVAPA
jgi:hypothetical protein